MLSGYVAFSVSFCTLCKYDNSCPATSIVKVEMKKLAKMTHFVIALCFTKF